MGLKLIREGDTSYLQDHFLLKNLDLENQHPITAIIGLESNLLDKENRITDIENKIENGEIGGGSGSVGDISPLVERVKTLEQNIVILNKNNITLKEVIYKLLDGLNYLENELIKTKLIVDEYHKNTNLEKNSFTDTLINDDYIDILIDCKIDIDNDNVT